jgi:hypothetical protein
MRRRRTDFYLGIGTLLCIGGIASLVYFQPFAAKADARPVLVLKGTNVNGRIRVDWDGTLASVQRAQGGTLDVQDGGVRNRYPVEPKVLRSGTLDYIRKTDDVLLRLILYHNGQPAEEASIRSVPALTAPAPEQQTSRRSRP